MGASGSPDSAPSHIVNWKLLQLNSAHLSLTIRARPSHVYWPRSNAAGGRVVSRFVWSAFKEPVVMSGLHADGPWSTQVSAAAITSSRSREDGSRHLVCRRVTSRRRDRAPHKIAALAEFAGRKSTMLAVLSLSPTLALPKSLDIILSSGFLCFSSHAGALRRSRPLGSPTAVDALACRAARSRRDARSGRGAADIGEQLSAQRPIKLVRPTITPWRGLCSTRARAADPRAAARDL